VQETFVGRIGSGGVSKFHYLHHFELDHHGCRGLYAWGDVGNWQGNQVVTNIGGFISMAKSILMYILNNYSSVFYILGDGVKI
jgi:hypothetical protein